MKAKESNKSMSDKDAIGLLKKDHREMEEAFKEFDKLEAKKIAEKKQLADKIGAELLKHMKVEEEIFYPAIKESLKSTEDPVNEGVVEHAAAKVLIKEIKAMKGNEELFDSKVHVLAEQITHHVEEEEKEMFPKVAKSAIDLAELGQQLAERKARI